MKSLIFTVCVLQLGCTSSDRSVESPVLVKTTIPSIISSPARFDGRVVLVDGCLVVGVHSVVLLDCGNMDDPGLHFVVNRPELHGDIAKAMEFHVPRRGVRAKFSGLFNVAPDGRNTLTYQWLTDLTVSEP
jgi:hypothetical protein